MRHVSADSSCAPVQGANRLLLATASLVALAAAGLATPAFAQQSQELQEVVVTGSRITTSGFTAPTPTQVVGAEDIARNAEPNVFTTITQLPSLQGSSGASVNTFSTSSGQQGLSAFSLRGLGTIRTLTLLDGQRVVPSNVTGIADVSLFPQLLLQRVDVVTGGASASYGSDAVGGVVNFITDKTFEGFKANVSTGATTYGDGQTYLVQAAGGKSFLDGRLRVQVSGEYDDEAGVPAGGFGEELSGSRDWYTTATLVNRGVNTTDGGPQYLFREHAQAYQYTKYGLINAGPLQGIAFDQNGNPFQFQYGSNGVPARNAAGDVIGCYSNGGFCVGGDLSGNVGAGTSLQSKLKRVNGYTRIAFDLNDHNEIYTTLNWARVESMNQPNPGSQFNNLTIQCANPFVPASISAACAANNITSFRLGASGAFLPNNISVHPTRTQFRAVVGATGDFDVFGKNWRYDAYYTHGESSTDLHVQDILLNPRYRAAIDATVVNGQVVCRDPRARALGCVPINVLGGFLPSREALAYIQPENGPFQDSLQKQDVVSVSFSGEIFSLWAGPVATAFGAEHRREWYRVRGDSYGDGFTDSPPTADYPVDPILDPNGSNWYAGNYHSGRGKYDVTEAFLEFNVPLVDNEAIGKANLNVAGRWTDYSTSGTVYTWKVGGTWETPLSGVRLRAVTSRDVRAPNLSELFAAPTTTTNPNFTNPFTGTGVNVLVNTIGNTNLTPEIARNTEAGIVLSRPDWLPGLSLSFDYYNIEVEDVINSLGAQQIVNFCFSGLTEFCSAFNFSPPNGATPFINAQVFNLASIKTSGFDIEGSYQVSLERFGLPGELTLRGLATHVREYKTDPGIPGTIVTDTAGQNTGATPDWKFLAIQNWDGGRWNINLQERWFSDGTYGNQYIVCQTGCPVSTVNNPTIDQNTMKGAFYVDLGGSFDFTEKFTGYFKINNLFDRDPEPSPQTNTGLDVNPALYDLLGRVYRVGLRYNF
ncbi:TonB-dependent receptor plug domain-containing protein [Phenylobacterium deserti]|uniref:TonB-dependent receptor n=1 Tax=Phenylobacterium deserti TaxID=1914756 RepID=A0A328ACL8_9CAUL|nr:TonB-dependent receptor [Phenylobacterium deserti]RAK52401.1 TonB-dependent receptor [Phenylobacterium deserti]